MGKGLLGNPRANYDINMLTAQHISLSCAFFFAQLFLIVFLIVVVRFVGCGVVIFIPQ